MGGRVMVFSGLAAVPAYAGMTFLKTAYAGYAVFVWRKVADSLCGRKRVRRLGTAHPA
ncbi:short chain dehydrogenase/reductase family oxidoreductase [Neisseria bacilliformis ATCC BAA-1200]|uniref:Short chain dehydrogenase/reductase family oxidoreductase n=1 Tax=Neisseria bacilliformis ATCC BAA-1200 TaxID=888742 RepID=F2BFT5_9NEIS|nr:short chain dehydrogenase/reductase family oxidoreductase [Neisseria bacilliformis ATCC BAA-1200]